MKKNKIISFLFVLCAIAITDIFSGCTKIEKGFISPYQQYAVNQFTVIRGRVSTSYSLINDGSSIPMHIKWTHIYDSTGKVVDEMFSKKYTVGIWTAAYNAATDQTYATIMAKRSTAEMEPIVVNENNGTITSNEATLNIPLGSYTMDLEVSNVAGTVSLKKIMQINIVDGLALETAPEQGSFANGRAPAGTASVTYFYNGSNNPYVKYNINRYADTPNVLSLKFVDKNGVPFNPNTEVIKRPAAGLDPNPPFLQNLQDYAPDTYAASDTAISIKFPIVPFPVNSLGNGYNMYYHIKTSAVQIDSTSSWSGNAAGIYYQGTADPHYLGTYVNDEFDYSIRVPMRIFVPGSYEFTVKILNVTHR